MMRLEGKLNFVITPMLKNSCSKKPECTLLQFLIISPPSTRVEKMDIFPRLLQVSSIFSPLCVYCDTTPTMCCRFVLL